MYFSSASLRIGDRRRVFCAAAKLAAVARSAGFVATRANSKLQRQPFNFQHYSQFRYIGGPSGRAKHACPNPPRPAPAPWGPSIDARRAQGEMTVQTGRNSTRDGLYDQPTQHVGERKFCDSGAKFAFTVEAEVVG